MTKKTLLGLMGAALLWPQAGWTELEIEPTPNVMTLPAQYPSSWLFAHDANFFSLVDGKVVLLDVAADSRQYKGSLGASQFASFLQSRNGRELYVAETFYSRGTRGERTDVVTIYDRENLAPVDEILLPGNQRGHVVTQKATLQQTRDGRFLMVFNFTPAASVTVIDIKNRKIINDIAIPGCSLMYPTGESGFSTLCGNGTMMSFVLDRDGKIADQATTETFNDISNNPLFMKMAEVDGVAYFPTFKGDVVPVDLRGTAARLLKRWSLVPEEERGGHWRPAGWQVVTADDQGRLYVLMQEGGREGSHKDGGGEVWVYDVQKKTRLSRHVLKNWGISIEATRGDEPYLAVTNADMSLDVYRAESGEFIRNIGGRFAEMPIVLHAAE
ncbi:amine dehydrogenase large subunit [Luteithermobacter gelatinilyticus]|uniref:amine dehydrogenase large subunit n=1 Tax=Luteithermobacter gelatinilyticus TaxID=2582913 RepID=UPI001105CB95|nr:amine dehydrogenase large subunit [Luteithermobacter gelatinilyticus]